MMNGFQAGDLVHPDFEFICQHRGQRGMYSLTHFATGHADVDAAVRFYADKWW